MASNVNEIVQQVNRYCQTADISEELPPITQLATSIFAQLAQIPLLERWELIGKLRSALQHKLALPNRVDTLKQAFLKKQGINWKDQLLDSRYEAKLNLHTNYFQYSNRLDRPIERDGRTQFFEAKPFSAYLGSTFATNIPKRITDHKHHVMDAAYAVACLHGGYAMALSDGAGGHFGDEQQDFNIAQAAHAPTKIFARLTAAYNSPELLLKELPNLVKLIAKEVQRKGKGESCTLVGCRVFPHEQGFRVVGLNIGDCMLIAWEPARHKLHQLLPAHASSAGTALLPSAHKKFEIYTLDQMLPDGCYLFLMTDGIHDSLAFEEEEGSYENGLGYRKRRLTQLESQLKTAPLEEIMQQVFLEIERTRMQAITKPDTQIGDDIAILQCQLKQ